MLTLNFFLFICTFDKLNCARIGSSIKEHLPDVLSYLSPGVDVCGKIHDEYGTVGTCCTGMLNTYIYLFHIIIAYTAWRCTVDKPTQNLYLF
jgi:hypothetical protein